MLRDQSGQSRWGRESREQSAEEEGEVERKSKKRKRGVLKRVSVGWMRK